MKGALKLAFAAILASIFLPLCHAQAAPDPLTQDDYKAIASAGVPLDSKMVTELTAVDRDKLKQIIANKPATEVKSFLVTRYVVRLSMASGDLPDLDKNQIALIQENLDLQYSYDTREELLAYNSALYYQTKYGIQFARELKLN